MNALPEQLAAALDDPKLANELYHDHEAASYDGKWSISFDDRCTGYALDRFDRAVGEPLRDVDEVLEIGAGTGFFLLNLRRGGVLRHGTVTDLSAGMVAVAQRNAVALGGPVAGQVADAEELPFPDESFDLVIGHAVLHHIPDLDRAFAEVLRVLRPGGRFVFAGEPTRRGDVVARGLSRAAWWATTRVTALPLLRQHWARPRQELAESSDAAALESVVDLHTFEPHDLARIALRAGAVDVRTVTEEFTAAWFGWPMRTVEAAINPDRIGPAWAQTAYRSWLGLSWIDRHLLDRLVPAGLFYNVSLSGRRP
jgi:ubiquinone/menaquinone biosynthesis C-methylase UbiE